MYARKRGKNISCAREIQGRGFPKPPKPPLKPLMELQSQSTLVQYRVYTLHIYSNLRLIVLHIVTYIVQGSQWAVCMFYSHGVEH